MYYTYGPDCDGWVETRKFELARRVRELVGRHGRPEESGGEAPYVEVDDSGVRLRYVASLDEEGREKMRMQAEQIYREVM